MSDDRDFKQVFTTAVESAGWGGEIWDRRRDEHPDAGLLAAYHDGELDPADVTALQDHLSTCSECAGLVMDRAAFPDLPAVDGEPGELDSARAWRKLEKALPAALPTMAPSAPPAWRRAVGRLAAAGLAVACLGLGGWNLQLAHKADDLEQRVAELTAPQPNVPLVYLGGDRRGDEAEAEVLAGAGPVVLYFDPSVELDRYTAFEWSLERGDSGEVVAGGGGLRPVDGVFTLSLQRRALVPGTYQLELRGLPAAGGDAEPLPVFAFHLAAE